MKLTDNPYYKEWNKQKYHLINELKNSKDNIHLSEYNFEIEGYRVCGVGLINNNGETISFEFDEKEPNIYKLVYTFKEQEKSYECFDIKYAVDVMREFSRRDSKVQDIPDRELDNIFNAWRKTSKGLDAIDNIITKKTFWDKVYDGWQGLEYGFKKLIEVTQEFVQEHKKSFIKVNTAALLFMSILSYAPNAQEMNIWKDWFPQLYSREKGELPEIPPNNPGDVELKDNTNGYEKDQEKIAQDLNKSLPPSSVNVGDTKEEGLVAKDPELPVTVSPEKVEGYEDLIVYDTNLNNPNKVSSDSGSGTIMGSNPDSSGSDSKTEVPSNLPTGTIEENENEYTFNEILEQDIVDAINSSTSDENQSKDTSVGAKLDEQGNLILTLTKTAEKIETVENNVQDEIQNHNQSETQSYDQVNTSIPSSSDSGQER